MSSTKKAWRVVSWPILALGLCAPWITNCGSLPKGVPGGDMVPGGGSCPDVSSAEAIEKYDFKANFKLDAEVSGKLKAGLSAAADLKGFSDSVEADLKTACTGLASDLGESGTFATANDACKGAMKAMADVKVKMGASATIKLEIKPPACSASMDAYASCAGSCDVNVKPGEAKVECEPGKLSGECDAQCSGECDLSAAAKCDGQCSGSCDATMSGSCSGKCNGKCDGKTSNGASCNGKCEGKCDANVEGSCSGKCGGSCKMKAAASCSGTCTGSCSATFKAPKCTGEITPPKMSADCKAKCDAKVQAHAECTPAAVGVRIEGAADATAAATYKTAIEKNLPLVLKIAIGMGERASKLAGSVSASVEGVEASVKSSVGADPMTGAKLMGCIAAPFKGALDGAAALQANVKVSVDVKASASASGSAKAG